MGPFENQVYEDLGFKRPTHPTFFSPLEDRRGFIAKKKKIQPFYNFLGASPTYPRSNPESGDEVYCLIHLILERPIYFYFF